MKYYIDSEHRAYLPSFRGLVCPEFIAEGGVVQIPVNTIATSGEGSAISGSVSGSLTNTLGASTANAVGAMSSAAFSSLVSQAGIALVNNQGDIKKTLKQLGQKDSIKQLATSVVTAGLLSKLGNAEWFKKLGSNTQTVLDDKILKSVIDSTARVVVETGINGGSLSENLEKALENSFINLAQGEMAHFIGSTLALDATEQLRADNLKQYLLHKLAHAAAGCIAGAAKKDCEAGIVGAVVGEVMMEHLVAKNIINNIHNKSTEQIKQELEKMKDVSKFTVSVISAYLGYDVNMAVQSAENALKNNNMDHFFNPNLQNYIETQSSIAQNCNFDSDCIKRIHLGIDQLNYDRLQALTSVKGAVDYYADMTIINVSGGMIGTTLIINNKNGKIFYPKMFVEQNINPLQYPQMINKGSFKPSFSVSVGSIVGGVKNDKQIDAMIEGASITIQGCYIGCAGVSQTLSGDKIYIIGIGTPTLNPNKILNEPSKGSAVTLGNMTYSGYSLTKEQLDELRKRIGK